MKTICFFKCFKFVLLFNFKTFAMKSNSLNPKHERDNRSNQLNPNNNAYRTSRGLDETPSNPSSSDDDDDYRYLDDSADFIPCADWED